MYFYHIHLYWSLNSAHTCPTLTVSSLPNFMSPSSDFPSLPPSLPNSILLICAAHIYPRDMGHPLEHGQSLRDPTLKKMDSPFPRGHQLSIDPQLGWS